VTGLDRDALVAELTAGVDGAEAVARELVDDWAREAEGASDSASVLSSRRDQLAAATAEAGDRLRGLELEALRHRLGRISSRARALALRARYGDPPGDAARVARALIRECEEIAAGLERIGPGRLADAMRRDVGDSMLDARYVLEGVATSPRLADTAGPEDGPPDLPA